MKIQQAFFNIYSKNGKNEHSIKDKEQVSVQCCYRLRSNLQNAAARNSISINTYGEEKKHLFFFSSGSDKFYWRFCNTFILVNRIYLLFFPANT